MSQSTLRDSPFLLCQYHFLLGLRQAATGLGAPDETPPCSPAAPHSQSSMPALVGIPPLPPSPRPPPPPDDAAEERTLGTASDSCIGLPWSPPTPASPASIPPPPPPPLCCPPDPPAPPAPPPPRPPSSAASASAPAALSRRVYCAPPPPGLAQPRLGPPAICFIRSCAVPETTETGKERGPCGVSASQRCAPRSPQTFPSFRPSISFFSNYSPHLVPDEREENPEADSEEDDQHRNHPRRGAPLRRRGVRALDGNDDVFPEGGVQLHLLCCVRV